METVDPAKLTADLGGKWHRSYGVAPCPVCQLERRPDQNALSVTVKGDTLLMNCKKSNCDFRDILTAAGVQPGHAKVEEMVSRAADKEREAQAKRSLKNARSMWARGEPIVGTIGEVYLRGRGITCELPPTLRWLRDTYHGPSGGYCSAMIADVSSGGIHRTFFTKQGERLRKSAKLMLGPCQGGAVQLSDVQGPLVVCEGIETGLSLLSGLLNGPHNVWAALSTSGVRGLDLPEPASQLIVAPDGDRAGRDAVLRLGGRAKDAGWDICVMNPPDGQDWNDVLQGREVL